MSKIVTITGIALADGNEPHEDVVVARDSLSELLSSGAATGIAAIVQRHDGHMVAFEAGPFDLELMIGHLHCMIHRLTRMAEEQNAAR